MASIGGFGELISLEEAIQIIEGTDIELGEEALPLTATDGRILSHDIESAVDVPQFEKAAMDGYAVRASDTFGFSETAPGRLKIVEEIEPGDMPEKEIITGTCAAIATGAPMPHGTDAVIMVELTEQTGDEVVCRKAVAPGEQVVKTGSDIRCGELLFSAGTVLNPRYIGALAAAGVSEATVKRKPRVRLFSTGRELTEPGERLAPSKVYNINSATLRTALVRMGCVVEDRGIIPDDDRSLTEALAADTSDADIIILSGSSSVGAKDVVPSIIERLGELLFHGVALKPGKPTAFGKIGDAVIFALPGYPTSALSNLYILVEPFLEKVTGRKFHKRLIDATLAEKVISTIGRYQFLPVQLEGEKAIPIRKGSSAITALAQADGFVEISANTEVINAGSPVKVRLF